MKIFAVSRKIKIRGSITICILFGIIIPQLGLAGSPGPEISDYEEYPLRNKESEIKQNPIEQHEVSEQTLSTITYEADTFVDPERVQSVRVSARDINRVNCPGKIEDVAWSQEKPVKAMQGDESNLYVKFLVRQESDKRFFATEPADFHILCDESIYTIIMHPHPIDSVTIRLSKPLPDMSKVANEWNGISIEERIIKIVNSMWKNEIPDGFFRSENIKKRKDIPFSDVNITQLYSMRGYGSGLVATEYSIRALHPVTMNEEHFLRPELGNIISITIDPLVLYSTGEEARMIIVERAINNVY